MAFFKVKVDGKVYELERLTLGDGRVLKRDFGLTDLEFFSPTDPDHMVGLLALAISKQDGVSLIEATQQAEAIDFENFEPQDADDEPDPTKAEADNAATVEPAKSGSSEKRQKKPGTRN